METWNTFEKNGVNPCVFQNLKFLELTNNVNQQNKNNYLGIPTHSIRSFYFQCSSKRTNLLTMGENENDEEDELNERN